MPKTSIDTRNWLNDAVAAVEADANRSADTHLHRFLVKDGVSIYLKDESIHPTGSLKHRLARSLFLYALANGQLGPKSTVVEASSGSTAVSEAYFAHLIGLPFVAVMPAETSQSKIDLINWYGGECHLVDEAGLIRQEAQRIADERGGHFMDQFTFAERATDWRGNNNIAESIFAQMSQEPNPIPDWIVVGAGTGGTSATIGRYIRYRRYGTQLLVADPEGSAFYEGWRSGDRDINTGLASHIEGIGRPVVEPSFICSVVDDMMQIPDSASIGAMRWVSKVMGRSVGPSTGTNMWATLKVAQQMRAAGQAGSIVTLLCDGGERYADTYYNDNWVAEHGFNIAPYLEILADFEKTGEFKG